MKKVFIFGYYGFQNIGDEAILSAIVSTLKKEKEDIQISALSYNAQYTEKLHGIHAVSRNSLRGIIQAIKEADLVISGGGSLLQDITSSRSLIYYLSIIYLAKKMGKKVMFYGNGFGPITKQWNRHLLQRVLRNVDRITLRDYDSMKTFEAIGLNKSVEVTADATFVLEPEVQVRILHILEQEEIPMDKPLIGISVRPWKHADSIVKVLASVCDYIIERNMNVVFLPMQFTKDIALSEEICSKMKNKAYVLQGEVSPKEMIGIIGKMDFLIGMRLHALIFAARMGVPMIGIEYDPKIKGFLDVVKQTNIGKVEELDFIKLCSEFDRLWNERESNEKMLQEVAAYLKRKAAINGEIAVRLLE
ncbi:polysaccharide pyruvyl transferase CsaB [Geosporobacter ferrireducens]|uniref:Polysaccharide pyruvyl transferase CsaB n=1 Tax=Geosporobacter ferrireducens TaxID=1424294 RepID=A0A1D8GLD0_9FIRM|nr:polysaccharide pyruvyl transferase CsaB [Geosporobacter ferrireducens]AOT71713.1 polysaccharide pyruvyl transferase CsaB [Geosporobacter ferrireducens]MTI55487.1 polysaccharide pyruvyl transferase CsaB [Geosporobacter ferrireducens]